MGKKINTAVVIRPLRLIEIQTFTTLRSDIDKESEYLIAKNGERKQGVISALAVSMIHRNRNHLFIAWDNNKAVGYLSLVFAKFKKYRGNAYLVIALRTEYRNQGIGSRLMDTAEEFAKTNNKHRMELEVFAKNVKAIELYKRRGYVIEGVKKNAVEDESGFDDVVIMAKAI